MNLNEEVFQDLKDRKLQRTELDNKNLFKYLIENDLLDIEDIQYWLGQTTNSDIIDLTIQNLSVLKQLLKTENFSFQELIDKCKRIHEIEPKWKKDLNDKMSCLAKFLKNEKVFEELIDSNKLNQEDLKYLLKKLKTSTELECLDKNQILLQYFVDNALFQKLVDNYKSIHDESHKSSLSVLLKNTKLFENLLENNDLTTEDLKYFLNSITNAHELYDLCRVNKLLFYTLLNEYVLDKTVLDTKTLDRFETIIEKDDWCEQNEIHDVFDLISLNTDLCLLNKFDLSLEQKLESYIKLKDNEVASNKLKYIVDNHLEDSYNFESLMSYLRKTEKKNLINI